MIAVSSRQFFLEGLGNDQLILVSHTRLHMIIVKKIDKKFVCNVLRKALVPKGWIRTSIQCVADSHRKAEQWVGDKLKMNDSQLVKKAELVGQVINPVCYDFGEFQRLGEVNVA